MIFGFFFSSKIWNNGFDINGASHGISKFPIMFYFHNKICVMLISHSFYTFIRWIVSIFQFMAKSQADFTLYTWLILKYVYVYVSVYVCVCICQNGDDSATYFLVCSMMKQACCQIQYSVCLLSFYCWSVSITVEPLWLWVCSRNFF